MDSIKILIDRYGLQDPVREERGLFTSQTIQALYEEQTEIGKRSLEDALGVGATVEEISIMHLGEQIDNTDRVDMIVAYEGLLTGSQKHLISFVSTMGTHGYEYTPHFLSPEEYDQIISGSLIPIPAPRPTQSPNTTSSIADLTPTTKNFTETKICPNCGSDLYLIDIDGELWWSCENMICGYTEKVTEEKILSKYGYST